MSARILSVCGMFAAGALFAIAYGVALLSREAGHALGVFATGVLAGSVLLWQHADKGG